MNGRDSGPRAGATIPVAHVAYLQGLFLWNRFTGESVKAAIQHFQEALAVDPNYAVAYDGLGEQLHHARKPPHPTSTRGLLTGAQGRGAGTRTGRITRPSCTHRQVGFIVFSTGIGQRLNGNPCGHSNSIPVTLSDTADMLCCYRGWGATKKPLPRLSGRTSSILSIYSPTPWWAILCSHARRFERSLAPYRKCLELDPTLERPTPILRARWST